MSKGTLFVQAMILTAFSMTCSGSALFSTGNSDKNSGSVAITTGVAIGGAGGSIVISGGESSGTDSGGGPAAGGVGGYGGKVNVCTAATCNSSN